VKQCPVLLLSGGHHDARGVLVQAVHDTLPETAADKNVGIPDIENLENNIHAGHNRAFLSE